MEAIYLSDYAEESRKQLFGWLRGYNELTGSAEPFDWGSVTRYLAQMEGQPGNSSVMEQEARARVKGILPCDVTQV